MLSINNVVSAVARDIMYCRLSGTGPSRAQATKEKLSSNPAASPSIACKRANQRVDRTSVPVR